MSSKKENTVYNCHTHVFTIDHVPNLFAKKLIPVFYKVFTMNFIKWYFKNCTARGNQKIKKRKHQLSNIKHALLNFCKKTILLHWIYLLLKFVLNWFIKIIANLIRIDFLFSKRTKEAFNRYMTLGRYSVAYKSQAKIYDLLEKSYAPNTKFVVLTMDMDYMDAGKPTTSYLKQLEELDAVKKNNPNMLPFIFLDPRRIAETKNEKGSKNYTTFLKKKLASGKYAGIKMYPALGYYPFDKELMEIYAFAEENEIPIMTHCIEGTVFYRGKKKKEWNYHPILKYTKKKEQGPIPIPLPQSKNYDFTTNFTHPLNYHCLLNVDLLKQYTKDANQLDLRKLKVCLAHFGGTNEWEKYKQDNWKNYNNNISHATKKDYQKYKNTLNHGSKRTIWWNASWLSVIYDLMVEYENVYTDVSFILFNEELFPLLKFILQDDKVNDKILFGTDYYVVSQKKTEKVLYHNLQSYLGEELFYKISNTNPKKYLSTKFTTY